MKLKTYTWKEAFENSHQAAKAGVPRAQVFVGNPGTDGTFSNIFSAQASASTPEMYLVLGTIV
jgi:hypothetical protein